MAWRSGPGRGRYYYDFMQSVAEQVRKDGLTCDCGTHQTDASPTVDALIETRCAACAFGFDGVRPHDCSWGSWAVLHDALVSRDMSERDNKGVEL